MAGAAENAVTKKNIKSFDLDVNDEAIMNQEVPGEVCCDNHDFGIDGSPSAGEAHLVEQMKIEPEFRYSKPQEYRTDVYDTEVKVNMKLPVDFY